MVTYTWDCIIDVHSGTTIIKFNTIKLIASMLNNISYNNQLNNVYNYIKCKCSYKYI